MKKTCSKCCNILDVSDFYKDKTKKDGHSSWCKMCRNDYGKLYNLKNRQRLNKLQRDWVKKNPEKKSLTSKKYYKKNIEKIKKYRNINKVKKKITDSEYAKKNKEKISKYQKMWRKTNIKHLKEYRYTILYKQKKRLWDKEYFKNNRNKILVNKRKYVKSNKNKIRSLQKNWQLKQSQNLTDAYIKNQLIMCGFTTEQIKHNPELIELKRLQLKGVRKVRQLKFKTNDE